ncbi:MAG: hypothetical protein QHH43_06100 [Candidatus Saccharicenans sp.]|jgi:hypothetical protein|nr:hypothetical protein [Candidatus Saccharicenans sp.]MDH7575312.1 hypothetical protein [Candidatus Saccharicenans sp.]
MKRVIFSVLWVFGILFLLVSLFTFTDEIAIAAQGPDRCTKIQDGLLVYSAGHYLEGTPIKPGFDPFGYNYQAHMFNGYYCNAYLGRDGYPPYEGDDEAYFSRLKEEGYTDLQIQAVQQKWYWPYRQDVLSMKWNDAWLSNMDCDGDGQLDRHYGYSSYIGSGAWLTNHQPGTYKDATGKECQWTWFEKIVAVPADATLKDGKWYRADGTEIGPAIWGSFAIIQSVYNDPCGGYHGVEYLSPAGPGLGKWD